MGVLVSTELCLPVGWTPGDSRAAWHGPFLSQPSHGLPRAEICRSEALLTSLLWEASLG